MNQQIQNLFSNEFVLSDDVMEEDVMVKGWDVEREGVMDEYPSLMDEEIEFTTPGAETIWRVTVTEVAGGRIATVKKVIRSKRGPVK